MIRIREAGERGSADHGWLDTRHTFSFAGYHDPNWMGFRDLRVINEDRVRPGAGFGMHSHRDMEIISYLLDGALAHRDSMGNGSTLRAGDVQRMTAGTGVRHSEMNPSESEPAHFLQIWVLPEREGLEPGYEEKHFPTAQKRGRFRRIASRDGRDGSLTLHQDVELFASVLAAGARVEHALRPGRHAWVQIARGAVSLSGRQLRQGDGAAVSDEPTLTFDAVEPAELLLFDLR